MVRSADRRLFDDMLDELVDGLPEHLHDLLEQVPLIVEDEPSRRELESLGIDPGEGDLLGLHEGVALTDRSVEAPPTVPDRMMLFRGPILRLARADARQLNAEFEDVLHEQIQVTLLHEIGHHFGLDEDDLEELGYA